MQNENIHFLSNIERIIETREYSKYFDEPVNVYNLNCNKRFDYYLSFDCRSNQGKLEIPNCGGMVDNFPKSQLQQQWTEEKLQTLNVSRTWSTCWSFSGIEAYISFLKILDGEEAELKNIKYSTDLEELNKVFQHIFSLDFPLTKIIITNGSKVDGFDADALINKYLREFLGKNIYSKCRFVEMLNEILKTDKITIDSKIQVNIQFK